MGMIGHYLAIDEKVLQQIQNSPEDLLNINIDEYPSIDIDKSWQGIHFLLCNSEAEGELPLGNVVPMRSENALDVEIEDFIGVFVLSSKQVSEAYEAIKNINEEEVRSMYNFESFMENEIYPIVEDEDTDDFFDYIYENFKSVQEFYKSVSESGDGVIFYIM